MNKKKSDKEIIDILKNNSKTQKDILFCFKNLVNNYSQIKMLTSSFNQSEALHNKIQLI